METLAFYVLHGKNVFRIWNIRKNPGYFDLFRNLSFENSPLESEESLFMAPYFFRDRIDLARVRNFYDPSFDLGMLDDDGVVARPHYVGRFQFAQKFCMVAEESVSAVDFVFRDVERKPTFHFGEVSHDSTLGTEAAGNWRRDLRCVSDGLSCGFQPFFHEFPASCDGKSCPGNH